MKEKKRHIEVGCQFDRSMLYGWTISEAIGRVVGGPNSDFEDYLKVASDVFRYDVSVLVWR